MTAAVADLVEARERGQNRVEIVRLRQWFGRTDGAARPWAEAR
ncbi:MAG: hypothetical protein ACXVBG_23780 [Isosphaeraceae bacterium]